MSWVGGPMIGRQPLVTAHHEPPAKRARTEPAVPDGGFLSGYTARVSRMARRPRNRRRYKRKRRGIIRKYIPRALVPREKLLRLQCVMNHSVWTCTSGALSAVMINLFDITDPYVGLSSAQPLGYDQIKTLWNKCYVVGVKVTAMVHNKGSAAVQYGFTPMPENQGSTALTTIAHYMELSGTKAQMLTPDVDRSVLVYKINPAKYVGVKRPRYEDAFHCDLDNETAPTRTAYLHLWCQPLDGATTNTCELILKTEFLVRVFDPIVPARSTDT